MGRPSEGSVASHVLTRGARVVLVLLVVAAAAPSEVVDPSRTEHRCCVLLATDGDTAEDDTCNLAAPNETPATRREEDEQT